jgi:two-component system chemotaxis sensor kinase CheA
LLGTADIVVRSLPELMRANAAVGGSSLNADGSPLLMLDVEGLVNAALAVRPTDKSQPRASRPLMVVDDSLTTRMLEQSILESAGYKVDVATSAEEALERARSADYALFLVDVEMPGMDGFGFIEEIRRDPELRDTPAILVTSLNAPEHKRRGEEVGAQGYVVKSEFDQGWLLGRIAELIA